MKFLSDNFFRRDLSSCHPLVLFSMFITVVLNVTHDLPERPSDFLLQMLRNLLKLAFESWRGDKDFKENRISVLKSLPKDVRTVRSRFGLDRQLHIFAACPNCSALYEPKFDITRGFNIYAFTYCNQRNLGGKSCLGDFHRVNGFIHPCKNIQMPNIQKNCF